jgi:hypothetical protein
LLTIGKCETLNISIQVSAFIPESEVIILGITSDIKSLANIIIVLGIFVVILHSETNYKPNYFYYKYNEKMARLSVNINKVATIRNARGGNIPNVVQVAIDCQRFGAEGITVHPTARRKAHYT